MKIVHIHQYYDDNMGYQENIFPRYQAKLGHEVIMLTSKLAKGFNGERIRDVGEYIDNNFLVKRIDIKGEFKNRFVLFKDLYKYLEELKPDYIYHHSVSAPSLGIVCTYKIKNPNVFLVVDNHLDLNISARKKLWKLGYYNIFWSNYIRKYDKYIDLYFGVTPTRCLFLKEELGVVEEKIRLLPIGADIDNININVSRKDLFSKYKIDGNKLILIHGGKITKEKRVDKILQAFSQIKDHNIEFILFGKIEDKKVEESIKRDIRIRYVGWLDRAETLAFLKYSDMGIWNTQHTTLLEDCIAVGLPMLLRYYGSTSHLIDNSGLYLYGDSVREIYDNLNFIVCNREILQRFKNNTINISKVLSYDNIAKESLEYFADKSPKNIHRIFMSKKYSDSDFRYFRVINKD